MIIDDHPIVREGLTKIITQEKDLSICGEAGDASSALKMLKNIQPDLLIINIVMEGLNGIDLTKAIRGQYPDIKILTLSSHKEELYAERALRSGSNGYINKQESVKTLMHAIRQVLEGHIYVSEGFNELILQKLVKPNHQSGVFSIDLLSDRELEVFQLIGQGYGTRQIAEELNISMKTVEAHREHIRSKCNFNENFNLVQQAIHWVHGVKNNLSKSLKNN